MIIPSSCFFITILISHLFLSYIVIIGKNKSKSRYLNTNIGAKNGISYSKINKME